MSAVIDIRNLRKAFRGHLGIGSHVAVDDLSLSVTRGEIFGLLGPNGAGKTTTLKMLLGLIRPDAGTIQLFGRSPRDVEARRRLGFLPENPSLYEYLTGREFVTLAGRIFGLSGHDLDQRVERVLGEVGMGRASKNSSDLRRNDRIQSGSDLCSEISATISGLRPRLDLKTAISGSWKPYL